MLLCRCAQNPGSPSCNCDSNHSTDAPLLSVTVPDEPVDCTSADHSATEPEPELLLAPLAIVSKPPVRLFVFTPLAIDASPILTVANTD